MRFSLILALIAAPCFAGEKIVLVAGGDKASLKVPFGMDFTPDGKLILVEFDGHCVSQIEADGSKRILAGTGVKGYADGPADKAQFNGPHNLAAARNGDIYVADTLNHIVRKVVAKTGIVSTVAGTGKKGFSGDGGPAKEATFNETYHIVLNKEQAVLYVADLGNRRIRAIDLATGIVRTVAGNGKKGVPEDGASALEAPLVDPRACALDNQGRLYILERSGNALRVVEKGKIRTVVGTGKTGFTGDGGKAVEATLNSPKLVYVDAHDDVLIVDSENNVIRKYTVTDGSINRLIGSGKRGTSGLGGLPLEAELDRPHAVTVAPSGSIYVADSLNNRILKVTK